MLNYSFPTVLMAVLASNLIIVLIALCFRRKGLLLSVGYKVLIAFLLLTLVRFVFPFELGISTNIYLPAFLSVPLSYFRHPFLVIHGLGISMWTLVECVWLFGIAFLLRKFIQENISFRRFINQHGDDVTSREPYAELLARVCGRRRNRFRILKMDDLSVPCVAGVLHPVILLPKAMTLTGDNLYYTLSHEVSHYYHRDLAIKLVVKLISIVYWWNPACKLLKEQIDLLLELRVDDSLAGGDREASYAYLHTLLHVAESSLTAADHKLPGDMVLSISPDNEGALSRRFEMLCADKRKSNAFLTFLLFFVVTAIYAGSYLVTFENHYMGAASTEGTYSVPASFYAVENEDGTYSIYCGNELIEITDSLEYYPGISVQNQ